jgi:hypothetical protein
MKHTICKGQKDLVYSSAFYKRFTRWNTLGTNLNRTKAFSVLECEQINLRAYRRCGCTFFRFITSLLVYTEPVRAIYGSIDYREFGDSAL